jgi:hypothetical protein
MKEILTILISVISSIGVNHGNSNVNMINFGGHAESTFFVGDVMQGGVDTQKTNFMMTGDSTLNRTLLSARYILSGTDCDGKPCKIFVENNAVSGEQYTHPTILTDSKALDFLNNNDSLKGKIDMTGGKLTIRIYAAKK